MLEEMQAIDSGHPLYENERIKEQFIGLFAHDKQFRKKAKAAWKEKKAIDALPDNQMVVTFPAEDLGDIPF